MEETTVLPDWGHINLEIQASFKHWRDNCFSHLLARLSIGWARPNSENPVWIPLTYPDFRVWPGLFLDIIVLLGSPNDPIWTCPRRNKFVSSENLALLLTVLKEIRHHVKNKGGNKYISLGNVGLCSSWYP